VSALSLRAAALSDTEALNALVRESVLGLSLGDYSTQQLESALRHLFGIDTRLIEDGTYYVVEESGGAIACGGWSKRRTLFGGDQYAERSDDRLAARGKSLILSA
jgi:hypothetical protein